MHYSDLSELQQVNMEGVLKSTKDRCTLGSGLPPDSDLSMYQCVIGCFN